MLQREATGNIWIRKIGKIGFDLFGQQQVVVKNLETNYRRVPGVSAATILGDGSVALILDIADLHRLHREKRQRKPRDFASQTASHSLTEDLSA